jgi:tetratricopeptide (TPR) repeat protein
MNKAGQANWQHYSSLKIKGLLTGSPEAWKKHLQCFLRAGMIDVLKSQLSLLLLLSVDRVQGGLLLKGNAESELADPDVDAIYARANSLIQQGRSKEAREYARALMEKKPDNIHVLRCYSKTCVLTSAWDDALASLCTLMGYYFSSLDIYYDLATVLQRKREFYGSRLIVRTLLRLNKKILITGSVWHRCTMLTAICRWLKNAVGKLCVFSILVPVRLDSPALS